LRNYERRRQGTKVLKGKARCLIIIHFFIFIFAFSFDYAIPRISILIASNLYETLGQDFVVTMDEQIL
jgi:hypothetical protein